MEMGTLRGAAAATALKQKLWLTEALKRHGNASRTRVIVIGDGTTSLAF